MIELSKFNSLIELVSYFKNESICREFIKEQRWGNVIVCPFCGCVEVYTCKDGKRLHCNHCNHDFSVLVGTIFENTKLPLIKWFIAMYLLSSHKKGISSHQLSHDIKVTQKTAWFMLHKIRTTFIQNDTMLENEVECDEAYIGGREANKHQSKKTNGSQGRSVKAKTPIFGMVERNGNVIARKVENTNGETLLSNIRKYVREGSRVFTDEWIGYHTLKDSEYGHDIVRHKNNEFVRDDAYTNTIEGFWAQLKRMIFGAYHFTSAKYLQKYVDEAVFRYDTAFYEESDRFALMMNNAIGKRSYEYIKKCAA
jgi:transposase-like protein